MTFSTRERISHVARRLGFGVEPAIVEASATVEDAVTAALDLSAPAQPPPDLDPPLTMEEARAPEQAEIPYAYHLAGAGERVLVMTTSEFGRRVAANGSGTDHGTAAPHLFIGDGVRGGRYGEAPDLSALDGRGNMIHTVDYRSVYASVLEGWLGAPAEAILGADYELLPLFEPAMRSSVGPV